MKYEHQVRKEKDKKTHGNLWFKVCNMISTEPNFPNDEIIEMYMCNNHGVFAGLYCIFFCIICFIFGG